MSSQNPVYFLRYLNIQARGEPIRWILEVSGAKYKEERINLSDWAERKSGFEWGVTPVLEVNGVQLHQTLAICRYLAKNHNMLPADNFEQARLEEVAESVHELTASLGATFKARFFKNVDQIAELLEKTKSVTLAVTEKIEKTISAEGWVGGKKMSWCDIVVASYVDVLQNYVPDICEKCPKLENLVKEVKKVPAIKNWISSRPSLQDFEAKF